MIDRKSIMQWHKTHPWSDKAYVEQDLAICCALVAIYGDPVLAKALAFRGGTALHKLYLSPQARYSEDIDLVQVSPGPIKPIIERLDAALAWLPGKSFDNRRFGFRMRFRYESEIPPVEPMRLKIEVNTYEHFTEMGYCQMPFTVESPWFCGNAEIMTYSLDELLGTKLRALYQRMKGRDLFDLSHAMKHGTVDADTVLRCFRRYMTWNGKTLPSRSEFRSNMEAKMAMPEYVEDVKLMLRPGTPFDVAQSYNDVVRSFIDKLVD